jgi:c(7)-type cytochrome triheme protein
MAAEKSEIVKPIDIVEGVTIQKEQMKNRPDMAFHPHMEHFSGIRFSHELHSKWNGCDVCHPEIFPSDRNNPTARVTMYQIAKGKFCGACHVKVAFPVNGCNKCHTRGPDWIDGPGWLM